MQYALNSRREDSTWVAFLVANVISVRLLGQDWLKEAVINYLCVLLLQTSDLHDN